MKNLTLHIAVFRTKTLLLLLAFLLPGTLVWCQDEPEPEEKADVILYLQYFERNNTLKTLEADVKSKVERAFLPVEGIVVRFYRTEASPENLIDEVVTNHKGRAICHLPENPADSTITATPTDYLAVVEDNDQYYGGEEMVSISESSFEMTLEEEDSIRYVRIQLTAPDENGEDAPVADAEVQIFVKRLFGMLPVMEGPEATDEDGFFELEFPAGIPGDTLGQLVVVARIMEHESYGNLEFIQKTPWGVPKIQDPVIQSRELWASRANAPIYLLVIVNTLIIGIWGTIFYILYQTWRIRKIGNA